MVLKLANKKKKKVIVASTSEVYGKSDVVPFREDADLVLGPTSKGRWSYACSKAIDEFLALADKEGAVGEVFNIGNDREEITMLELARRVQQRARSRSEIVLVPYDKAYEQGFEDMPRRVPDTTKIKNFIGWQPTIALPQILSDVVEYYRRGP